MRLSSRNVIYEIGVAPGTERPIRLRLGGITYAMDPAEAMRLAGDLADVIEQLRRGEAP